MLYNHRDYYWLFITIILCLSSHITQCNEDGESNEGEERSFWRTFASVAGDVASKAGDSVYSAASSGASTITGMFDDEDGKNGCDEDSCVENDKTSIEKSGGIFNTVTNTVSSAWSSTKEATGAALDGVRSTIASEVDAVLGTLGNKLATALTPGNHIIYYDLFIITICSCRIFNY